MTKGEIIRILDNGGYLYETQGDTLVIHENFNELKEMEELPEGIKFMNDHTIWFNKLKSFPPDTIFRNGGGLFFKELDSIPDNFRFENKGGIFFGKPLDSIPKGVEFVNVTSVSIERGDFNSRKYEGKIKGIDQMRLFQMMVKQGVLI